MPENLSVNRQQRTVQTADLQVEDYFALRHLLQQRHLVGLGCWRLAESGRERDGRQVRVDFRAAIALLGGILFAGAVRRMSRTGRRAVFAGESREGDR